MKHSIISTVVNRRSLFCCSVLLLVTATLHHGSDYWQDVIQKIATSAKNEDVDASPRKLMTTQTEDAENKKGAPSDVILVTYMRSGSSYLGKMLGHLNDSFYWYEPLWVGNTWTFYREDGNVCDYAKPVCPKTGGQADKSLEKSLRFLGDIYNRSLRNHGTRICFSSGQAVKSLEN